MNQHLRFVSSVIITAGAVFSATSCSSTKIEPLIANPKHQITYEVRIFDLPVGHSFGGQPSEILNAAEGQKLIHQIGKEPSFFKVTEGRFDEKKTVTNKKEFIYPTEYSPAEYKKPTDGSIFPVTPATPTAFDKTQVGTTVSFTGSKDLISVNLNRKILLGFVNYGTPITADASDFFGRTIQVVITENRIEKPRFRQDLETASTRLKQGEFLVIRNPRVFKVDPRNFPFTEKRHPSFIALIRATTR